MKKLLLFILAAGFAAMLPACSSDSGSDPEPDPYLNLSIPSIEATSSSATTRTFTITSSSQWTSSVSRDAASWVTVDPASGEGGETQVTVRIADNEEAEGRGGNVTFALTSGAATSMLEVSQAQKNTLDIDKTEFNLGKEGGEITVAVSHNVEELDVDILFPEGEIEEWISLKPGTRALSTESLVFTVDANKWVAKRSATIRISDTSNELSAQVTVAQSEDTPKFNVSKSSFDLSGVGGRVALTVSRNIPLYEVAITLSSASQWLTISSKTMNDDGNDHWVFDIGAFNETGERDAEIVFTNIEFGISEKVSVTQGGMDQLSDKSYFLLQEASTGNGVNLVLLGDGYTQAEIDEGKYTVHMKETMESFFSVYPYNKYRDHFNVWMVVGVSAESGVSTGSDMKNTRFESHIINPQQSTGIECNYSRVARYISYIPGMPSSMYDMDHITSILTLNSSVYAGTCMMMGNGFSVCMCPRIDTGDSRPNYGMKAVVIHESGGHGFGRLADEYVNYNRSIPQDEIDSARAFQAYGGLQNIDFTNDTGNILWKDFFGYDKYTDPTKAAYQTVGAYEGANYYTKGVWRPEENSCMIDNIDYYNAPSRWAIVKRIKTIAGLSYAFEQFVQDDNPPPPSYSPSKASYVEERLMPFAPPIMINL